MSQGNSQGLRANILVWATAVLVLLGGPLCSASPVTPAAKISPKAMLRIGTVDDRFQSYNIEMLEVTGGAFWKPYGASSTSSNYSSSAPVGMDPNIYQYRPPLDLGNARLRTLAKALGPAYVRVSGTWANTTYFADTDEPPTKPPPGFNGVLSRKEWKGVVDFANATNAKIVSSFADSPGTRDANGVWTSQLAQRWLAYTHSIGGEIAAAEFMNEPSMAEMGGAPKGYDASSYGRDFKIFRNFAKLTAPKLIVLGPGSVGETPGPWSMAYGTNGTIRTLDMLAASGRGVDAFSYHHYGAASQRCAKSGMAQTTAEAALSEDWLGRTSLTRAYYGGLRDKFEPGRPLWVTEVADAACGGNPWAGTFLDSFRYLDQLGRLAKEGVQVVMHNTLAASDYGLLNENDFTPKPNYWAALLWRRLMGSVVLDAGLSKEGLHLYAHCLRGRPGGVTLLAINNSRTQPSSLDLAGTSERYTLSAVRLASSNVALNGVPLQLPMNDGLPQIKGAPARPGRVRFLPATITFLAIPSAKNKYCENSSVPRD